MKIKGDYLLDTIGGEKMAVPITVNDGGLAGLIRLNEVGAFLWEKLQGGTTEAEILFFLKLLIKKSVRKMAILSLF